MTLDLIAISLAILLFARGFKKGIIVAIGSLLAVVLGIVCAMSLSAKLSVYLLDKGWVNSALAPLLSYALLFIAVLWLVRFLARLLEQATNSILLGWANKSIGGLLYIALGMVVYSSVLWLCNSAHILSQETIVHSKVYPYLSPMAPWVFDQVGQLIPIAKDSFADMRLFFDQLHQQLPEHVGTHR